MISVFWDYFDLCLIKDNSKMIADEILFFQMLFGNL